MDLTRRQTAGLTGFLFACAFLLAILVIEVLGAPSQWTFTGTTVSDTSPPLWPAQVSPDLYI